jgi:hypothetical protein
MACLGPGCCGREGKAGPEGERGPRRGDRVSFSFDLKTSIENLLKPNKTAPILF